MSRPNTPEQSIAPYTAASPYCCAMMIIGLSTVNVAPATTGSRTPKILPMPTLWITVATPDTNRSALTSRPIVDIGSFSAPPTMSGTATAPAYMMNKCWSPGRTAWARAAPRPRDEPPACPQRRAARPSGALVSDITAPLGLSAGCAVRSGYHCLPHREILFPNTR